MLANFNYTLFSFFFLGSKVICNSLVIEVELAWAHNISMYWSKIWKAWWVVRAIIWNCVQKRKKRWNIYKKIGSFCYNMANMVVLIRNLAIQKRVKAKQKKKKGLKAFLHIISINILLINQFQLFASVVWKKCGKILRCFENNLLLTDTNTDNRIHSWLGYTRDWWRTNRGSCMHISISSFLIWGGGEIIHNKTWRI